VSRRSLAMALPWLLTTGLAAQSPRDARRPVVPAAGQIIGRVVSPGVEPKPLRRARVTLSGPALQIGRTTITRDDGTFAFDALPPGGYSLAALKSGYIAMQYGATGPGRPGLPVSVAAGGRQTITIVMPRGSVITGIITGTDGQPLAGQQIRAMRYRLVPPRGDRRLVEVGGSNVIFGLPAGTYVVSARPRASAEVFGDGLRTVNSAEVRQALADVRRARDQRTPGPPAAPPPRSSAAQEPVARVAFTPVFYPGTTSASQARPITLGPGEERTGVDFDIDYVPVARISGSVVGPGGGATRAYVRLIPDQQDALVEGAGFRGVTTEANGAFAFDAVPPGRYVLAARASSGGSMALRYDAATTLWASSEVVVGGQDITGVVLVPVPGITLEGRLVFEGQRPPPRLTDLRMVGVPLSALNAAGGSPVASIASDGRLTVFGMPPGVYWPEFTPGVRNPIGAWWLKSLAIEGRELLDAPLDLGASATDLVLTFADTASQLGGRAVMPSGDPAANAMVVVFPVEPRARFFNSRRIAAVPIDAQGRYVVRNLPPGEYHVAASAALDQFDWFDPDVLQKLAALASKVTIRGDEAVMLDVMVR
jgi:hypothetical protein